MADSHYRRIELQAPEDLDFLIANARRAAAERLDLDLPRAGDEDGEDQYRARVEKLVYEYIAATFALIANNITINGLPPSAATLARIRDLAMHNSASSSTSTPSHEVYDPVDAALLARARALYKQEEDLRVEIATLRRTAPRVAAEKISAALAAAGAADDELLRARTEQGVGIVRTEDVDLGLEALERQERVERDFARGVESLVRLQKEMPSTAALVARAKTAGEFALTQEEA